MLPEQRSKGDLPYRDRCTASRPETTSLRGERFRSGENLASRKPHDASRSRRSHMRCQSGTLMDESDLVGAAPAAINANYSEGYGGPPPRFALARTSSAKSFEISLNSS